MAEHMPDMPEHMPIFKNNQNAYHARYSFTPKAGIELPKTGVFFLLWFLCQAATKK